MTETPLFMQIAHIEDDKLKRLKTNYNLRNS